MRPLLLGHKYLAGHEKRDDEILRADYCRLVVGSGRAVTGKKRTGRTLITVGDHIFMSGITRRELTFFVVKQIDGGHYESVQKDNSN
jgi:5-carboxymethyl-2-hydroxymuconate isomerase